MSERDPRSFCYCTEDVRCDTCIKADLALDFPAPDLDITNIIGSGALGQDFDKTWEDI